ncbi:MAG: cytoplasmic protein [Deltaproteobacteria bacterium]|nr:cytoplasmic protein [Deltaproteobacteria bacterium]
MAGRPQSEEELNDLIEAIIVDAYGDDEQLWAFRQAFEDDVELPAEAYVVGEPVTVLTIDYDGNERRGLTATCRREDRSDYRVAACDCAFPEGSTAARYIAAYRRWLGIDPYPRVSSRKPKATEDDLDMSRDLDLITLAVKGTAISCRIPGTERTLTLRPSGFVEVVPGECITVSPRKKWRYARHPYLAGAIAASRLDIPALGLTPLRLIERGRWDPKEHYWGEPGEPLEPWAKPLIKKGARSEYEMEQVLPGEDPDNPDTDPILEAVDLAEAGDRHGARRILMNLLAADLRCLDAHAHLGNLDFPHDPDMAVRSYDVGVKIGELSLGKGFNGLLPWACTDNRPFLRCLQGYGLCLWRFGRLRDAEKVFTRMLWLNPTDNQGARFNLYNVKEGAAWHE